MAAGSFVQGYLTHFLAPLCVWGGQRGQPPFLCGTDGGTRGGAFLTDTLCWVATALAGKP